MKIEQLRQLLEVYRVKSINQAAANIYISQPNLSLSLRNLETELGYTLFVRNSRGVSFTPKGENFVKYAESVVLQFDQLGTLYSEEREPECNSFALSNLHFRYVTEVACALYNRHLQNNPFKLFIREGDRDECIDHVYRGNTEIGVINIWSEHERKIMAQMRAKGIRYTQLACNVPTIVVGTGNPLYSSPPGYKINVESLRGYPCVMYVEEDLGVYSNTSEVLGVKETIAKVVVSSRAVQYEVLEHTNAFAIASTNRNAYKHATYYPRARSFDLENIPDIVCNIGWIRRRDYTPSPLALEYIQLLSSYLSGGGQPDKAGADASHAPEKQKQLR